MFAPISMPISCVYSPKNMKGARLSSASLSLVPVKFRRLHDSELHDVCDVLDSTRLKLWGFCKLIIRYGMWGFSKLRYGMTPLIFNLTFIKTGVRVIGVSE